MGTIQLYSGRNFDVLWPTPNSFTIGDVIQGLLYMPRFAGHTKVFYPVLQHCTLGARWFRKKGMIKEAKYYLFHEGEEGLGLTDLPSPIKYLDEMSAYRTIGKNVQHAVYRKLGLFGEPPKAVKELDIRMACAEAKSILPFVPDWAVEVDTSDLVIKTYKNLATYKKYFMKEYKLLFPNTIDITS